MSNEAKLLLRQKLGNRIKELRSEMGISQAELARMCDMERASLERIENAKINTTVYTISVICEALCISLKDFMDFNNAQKY